MVRLKDKFLAFSLVVYSVVGQAQSEGALDALMLKALLSYPAIFSRQSAREAAAYDLTAAKLKFLPSPSFNTQRNNVQFDSGQGASQMPATNISITQPLFLDGGIIAGHNKASARLSAADFALLETREDISRRIINSYVEWFKAWLKIEALEESCRLHEKFYKMIHRRYEQGVASGADRDLGISRLLQTKAELDTQRSLEAIALTSLSELVGESIDRKSLISDLANPVRVPPRLEGIPRAQSQSATVQRLEFEADAIEQEAKEIRAQAIPQLSIQAQRQIGNAYYPGMQGFQTIGLVVNYSPGGGFSSVVGASAALERANSARFQVDVARRELVDRLNADYSEYEFALLKKESLRSSVNLSEGLSASYDRQYLVGRKTWIDLMNSVREQTQTKMQLADSEGSLIGSSRRLMVYIDGAIKLNALAQ